MIEKNNELVNGSHGQKDYARSSVLGKTVALAGGGTGGPATPLIAVASILKQNHPDVRLIFIGTASGPEKIWAEELGLQFETLPAAKLRRYFSLQNVVDVLKFIFSFFKSLSLILRNDIDVVVGAGGFISVPVIWAAKILGRKVLIHQQDVEPTLSNKLTKSFANTITLTFQEQKNNFPKGIFAGNPVRPVIFDGDKNRAKKEFVLSDQPVILVFGGGSGAFELDKAVISAVPLFIGAGYQILHIVGKNSPKEGEFLNAGLGYIRRGTLTGRDMADALAAADLVICRAGIGTISELSAKGLAAIVVPMPDSHQELNGEILRAKNAARVLPQNNLSVKKLFDAAEEILKNAALKSEFQKNISQLMPHDAAYTIAELVYKSL